MVWKLLYPLQAVIDATIVSSQGIHNIKNYTGPEKNIVIAADNDDHKPESTTHKVIQGTKKQFENQGNKVTIIKPNTAGHDFNAFLQRHGSKAIQLHLDPVRAHQTHEKMSKIMDKINVAQSPDDKSTFQYQFKSMLNTIKRNDAIMSDLKGRNDQVAMNIEQTMNRHKVRGM